MLLFGKVKLLKKNVRTINKEDLKFKKPNFKINYIELVKNIDIDVEQIDLYIQLGTQDAASTAILVGTIAVILGIILKKPKYQVIPDYLNKNFLKIKLNCIFSIYLMQYIYKLILERNMVDVNTIIGEPIETQVGITIIPISKVSFGFAAGGSEFRGETLKEYNKKDKDEEIQYKLPFGGGAGAGVSINPVAFLVVQEGSVKLMPVDHDSCLDKILDYVPDLMQKLNEMFNKSIQEKEARTKKIISEMKNRYNENYKSPEVKKQDQKVEENIKKANYVESDGEVFGNEES